MSIIKKAVEWMQELAINNSHGYDQLCRWGERGDYDCSSAVITAWQQAGVPVRDMGATYTGNMYDAFLRCGFKDVTPQVNLSTGEGLQAGDVLLNYTHHTAMYIGDGLEVEASINEFGGVTGGQPGDQTGREILIRSYRNYPWDCVLRYNSNEDTATGPSKEVKWVGLVDADSLNVRTWAGVEHPNIKSIPELKENDPVAVCDTVKASDGENWYYVRLDGGVFGFVFAGYVKKVAQ